MKIWKCDAYEFPELIQDELILSMNEYAKHSSWIFVEEKYYDSAEILRHYATRLISQKRIDEGLSIITRHKLAQEILSKNASSAIIKPYFSSPPLKTFTYLENELFVKDDFIPSEEILREAEPCSFLCVKDFGFDPIKDIVWLDECETRLFDEMSVDLLASKVIGLACQYKPKAYTLESREISVLQFATYTRIYVFDSAKLVSHLKYVKLLGKVISDKNILKVQYVIYT